MNNQKYYLTGTKTAENLAKAFAGESQARMKYMFYAEKAKEEGYPVLQKIFLEAADNERGHAETFYDYLTSGFQKITIKPSISVTASLGSTAQNLLAAAEGERGEWSEIYPSFGRDAEKEGFGIIAESFYKIASVEKRHDERFSHMLDRMTKNIMFSLPHETTWVCINCGLHIAGKSAPEICPACRHSQSYFMTVIDQIYPLENQ